MTLLNKLPIRSPKSWQIVTSILVLLISCVVLLGWVFNVPILKSFLPDLAPMKANTALSFVLIGVMLWLLHDEPITRSRRRVARVLALVVIVLAILTLLEYLLGWNLGIDQLLSQGISLSAETSLSGRMSAGSSFSLLLLGLALWLIHDERRLVLTQFLALLVLGIGIFCLTSYLYGVTSFYVLLPFSMMSFFTAVSLII